MKDSIYKKKQWIHNVKLLSSLDALNDSIQELAIEDKMSFLYKYSKDRYYDELLRYRRLEDKSVKFLTSISIIIPIFLLMAKGVVETKGIYSALTYFVGGFTVLGFGIAWAFFLKALKVETVYNLPLTKDTIQYVKKKNMATIHWRLAQDCKQALDAISLVNKKKAKILKKGYNFTLCAFVFLVVFSCFIFYEVKIVKTSFQNNIKTEIAVMVDNKPDYTEGPEELQPAEEDLNVPVDEDMEQLNEEED